MMTRRSPHGPSRAASKPRRTGRWKAPANIQHIASPFAIDDEIRNAPLQSRWQLADAVAFGHRTLAVAIDEGRKHESYQPGEILASWKRTALLAEHSNQMLSQLIDHIGRRGVPPSDARGPTNPGSEILGAFWRNFGGHRATFGREMNACRPPSTSQIRHVDPSNELEM
jgi:hypothetical protein